MAQVVSSPMSLVEGLATLKNVRELLQPPPETDNLPVDRFVPGVPGEVEVLVRHEREGLTTLDLCRVDADRYELTVRHHPRDDHSTIEYPRLVIEPNHDDVTQRVRAAL
jgi:hypothetical protein